MTPRGYELSDFEWSIIEPLLPNKPRGVARSDDRKVLNGIYWRLRTGSPWAEIPERYGPSTTCYNRFVRWARIGVWDRIFEAISRAYDGDLQMIDSRGLQRASTVRLASARCSVLLAAAMGLPSPSGDRSQYRGGRSRFRFAGFEIVGLRYQLMVLPRPRCRVCLWRTLQL